MIAGTVAVMQSNVDLNQLSEDQLRHLVAQMLVTLDEKDSALNETNAALNEKDAALHARDETIRQWSGQAFCDNPVKPLSLVEL